MEKKTVRIDCHRLVKQWAGKYVIVPADWDDAKVIEWAKSNSHEFVFEEDDWDYEFTEPLGDIYVSASDIPSEDWMDDRSDEIRNQTCCSGKIIPPARKDQP